MTAARSNIEPEVVLAPDHRVLARRFAVMAAVTLGLLLALLGLMAIAIQTQSDRPSVERILRLAGVALAALILVGAIWGLLAGRPWAAPMARVLLWSMVLLGILDVVVALGQGTITIPIGAIAAILVLRQRPPDVGRLPSTTRRLAVIGTTAATFLFALALPTVSAGLLSPGASPFSVGPEALELTVETDCADASRVPPPPDQPITVTVRWHWQVQEWAPGGRDGLLIAWTADRDLHADTIEMPDGVTRHVAQPADALIEQAAAFDERGETFAIDVERVGMHDGAVRLTLSSRDDAESVHLTVRGAYAHLDRWLVKTDHVECSVGAA